MSVMLGFCFKNADTKGRNLDYVFGWAWLGQP